jgi:hypothetical protein
MYICICIYIYIFIARTFLRIHIDTYANMCTSCPRAMRTRWLCKYMSARAHACTNRAPALYNGFQTMRGTLEACFGPRASVEHVGYFQHPKNMCLQSYVICYFKWCPCMGRRWIFLVWLYIYIRYRISGTQKMIQLRTWDWAENRGSRKPYISGKGRLSREAIYIYIYISGSLGHGKCDSFAFWIGLGIDFHESPRREPRQIEPRT